MKKLFTLAIASLFAFAANASHIVGGQITAMMLNTNLAYDVKLTLYRDVTGIPMYNTEDIKVDVFMGSQFVQIASYSISKPAPTLIYGSAANGIEEYVFDSIIVLPRNGKYRLRWDNCCRNAGILNTTGTPGAYLETIITADSVNYNSSPEFLNKPFTVAFENLAWMHNPLPYDIDGDSLAWQLDVPYELLTAGFNPQMVPNYSFPLADTTMPFSIDSVSANMSWMPKLQGRWIASIICREYRNGVQIGLIRRDYQFLVLPAGSSGGTPDFTGTGGLPKIGNNYVVRVTPGSNYSLVLSAMQSSNDSIAMDVLGEAFKLAANKPTVTYSHQSRGNMSVNFNWNTTASMKRARPYITVFTVKRVVTNYVDYQKDLTVLFNLQNPAASTKDISKVNGMEVYPNPANGPVMATLRNVNSGSVTLEFVDMQGKVVMKRISNVQQGDVSIMIEQDLPAGIYMLRATQNGVVLGLQKVVISQ